MQRCPAVAGTPLDVRSASDEQGGHPVMAVDRRDMKRGPVSPGGGVAVGPLAQQEPGQAILIAKGRLMQVFPPLGVDGVHLAAARNIARELGDGPMFEFLRRGWRRGFRLCNG